MEKYLFPDRKRIPYGMMNFALIRREDYYYPDDLPGDVYQNQEELENYLADCSKQTVSEKHESFIRKYMTGCDGHSCERISKVINDYMNND